MVSLLVAWLLSPCHASILTAQDLPPRRGSEFLKLLDTCTTTVVESTNENFPLATVIVRRLRRDPTRVVIFTLVVQRDELNLRLQAKSKLNRRLLGTLMEWGETLMSVPRAASGQ